MKTINLITCDNLPEAYIIKGRLSNEGVDCFLTNENFTNLMPLYINIMGAGIQVMIRETDLKKAQQVLKDKLEPGNEELLCPYCSSNEIDLRIGKPKGLKIINMMITALLGIPMGYLKPKYYCTKCAKEF